MAEHNYDYDVLVVGSGPGGYVAAIRAAQLGLKTAIVERESLGGVCLNWGCIPKKALLKNAEVVNTFHEAAEYGITFDNLQIDFGSAVERSLKVVGKQTKGVGFLMKKNKIDVFEGHGNFVDEHTVRVTSSEYKPDAEEQQVSAENIILAVGARARDLPNIQADGEKIIQYRGAIRPESQPDSMLVIGAGPIGMELGYFYSSYGTDVTVVELMEEVLPLEDPEVSREVEKAFKKKGIKTLTGTLTESAEPNGEGVKVKLRKQKDDSTQEMTVDRVLIAVGVTPNTDRCEIDKSGVKLDKRGFIEVDENMRTNVSNIYAIGDCTGKLALAHVASAMAMVAAETIAGVETLPIPDENYINMPRCTYCKPEVASLGMTEAQATEAGYEIQVGKFPFLPNGKAQAVNETRGFIKIVTDAKYGEILGAHMVGDEATELLPELSLAQFMEITPAEIARTVHAHPTLSEVIMEAAHAVDGHPIHM